MVGKYVSTVQNSNKIEQIVKLSSDSKVMGSLVTPTIKQAQPLTLPMIWSLRTQTMRMSRSIIPPHEAYQQNVLPVLSLGIS